MDGQVDRQVDEKSVVWKEPVITGVKLTNLSWVQAFDGIMQMTVNGIIIFIMTLIDNCFFIT